MENGEQVCIWGDKVLATSPNHQVQSSCNGLDHEARVSTLINPATGWWDYTLVRDVFNTEDTTKICSMVLAPLSKRINWCRLA